METSAGTATPDSPAAALSRARERLLTLVREEASRQRAAILAADSASVRRSFETLSGLMMELNELSGAPEPEGTPAALLAAEVREQLQVNRALLRNGILAADHFVGCLAAAAPAPGAVLFSEVA